MEFIHKLQKVHAAFGLNALELSGAFVLAVVGLWVALRLVAFVLASVSPKKSIRSYGEWAVVTGATDGIGKAYAHELARRGLNVVLIARSADKLAASATEIAEDTKKKVDTITFDFSVSSDSPAYGDLQKRLANYNIGVLVNNVGTSYPSALYFHEVEKYAPNLVNQMINLNIVSTTKMTQFVLPGMLERKSGAIINIASAAGRIPIGNPLYAEYSGSKAYVDFFSRSLHHEYASKGIFVQCQSPYFVTTKMSKTKTSLTSPNPRGFAKAAVNAIGSGDSVVPYWSHAVQDCVLQSLPHFMLSKFLMNLHLGIRAKFQRKHAPVEDSEKSKKQ